MDISLIIPIYNVEKYLKDCLESAVNQTINNYEIILINDGSTDSSKEIAEKYEKKYKNIILINKENEGLGAARNTGIKNAHGKYICFLDSDDMITKDRLEKQFNLANEYNLDIVMSGCRYYYEKGLDKKVDTSNQEYVNTWADEKKVYNGKEFFMEEICQNRINQITCREMYKKSFLIENNIFYPEGILSEDIEFFVRTLLKAKRVMNIPKSFYIWRKRPSSITTSKVNRRHVESFIIVCNKLFEAFKAEEKNEITMNISRKILLHNLQLLIDKIMNCSEIDDEFRIGLFEKYVNKYMNFFCDEIIDTDYLFFGEQIHRLEKETVNFWGHIDKKSINNLKQCKERTNEVKREVLEKIPFNDKTKIIGVYGIGSHTISMINYYKKNIGEIKANLVFIDSVKGHNGEKFNEQNIINIDDIENYNFDLIVISSFGSQKMLCDNVNKKLKNKVSIYKFYTNNNNGALFT